VPLADADLDGRAVQAQPVQQQRELVPVRQAELVLRQRRRDDVGVLLEARVLGLEHGGLARLHARPVEVGERVVQLAVRRLGDGGGGEERQAGCRAGCRPAPSRRPTSRLPHCYR